MFNKANIVSALIVAANASAFTANMASGFGRQLRRGNKEPETPFTAADIPRISGLFAMFDADSNSSVEPKEIWAMYQSNKDATVEARMEFMKKMDSNMRTFCGVPQKPVSAVPVSRRGGRGRKGGKKGGKKNKKMGKWGKKAKMMMKKAKGMMWGLGGKMKVAKLFAPFSAADTDKDMKVSPMEMGVFMNKKARKMCKKYKKEQMKLNTMKWVEAGMPAEELAKMKAKRAEQKKKMEARKAQMMKKWGNMKKKWNSKKNKRGGRKGDKGRN
jgi:hypothetical protein